MLLDPPAEPLTPTEALLAVLEATPSALFKAPSLFAIPRLATVSARLFAEETALVAVLDENPP